MVLRDTKLHRHDGNALVYVGMYKYRYLVVDKVFAILSYLQPSAMA